MEIGIFVTTHLTKNCNYRHGTDFGKRCNERFFNKVIPGYCNYDCGVEFDLNLMDTGSNYPGFKESVDAITDITPNVKLTSVPNTGGVFAGIKYVMHQAPSTMDKYDYFMFHPDDSTCIRGDDWGKEIIEEYQQEDNLGIIGRELTTIRLGPTGLVDHRDCCSHIAAIYGINEVKTVPHLHADWLFMDQATLKELSHVWFDPMSSIEAMDHQKKLENMDYVEVLNKYGRKVLDDFHIGREVDIALRMSLINRNMATYKGSKIMWGK